MISGQISAPSVVKKPPEIVVKNSFLKKQKSWLGPLPHCAFGPKARTDSAKWKEETLNLGNQKLTWLKPPENILIIKRTGTETDKSFQKLATWLIQVKKLNVYVEPKLLGSTMKSNKEFQETFNKLLSFGSKACHSSKKGPIDLIVTIGGDGTLLYAASLFQSSMPPVIAFNAGSLGFLTAHDLKNWEKTVESVLAGNATLMLRSRLRCKVNR